jgi:hypothetical protein
MKVTVWGPNLNRSDQAKGNQHIHAADCADNAKMDRKYGGADAGGWGAEGDSVLEVTYAVSGDLMSDYGVRSLEEAREYDRTDPGFLDIYVGDLYWAPCTSSLPYDLEAAQDPAVDVTVEVTPSMTIQDAMDLLGRF